MVSADDLQGVILASGDREGSDGSLCRGQARESWAAPATKLACFLKERMWLFWMQPVAAAFRRDSLRGSWDDIIRISLHLERSDIGRRGAIELTATSACTALRVVWPMLGKNDKPLVPGLGFFVSRPFTLRWYFLLSCSNTLLCKVVCMIVASLCQFGGSAGIDISLGGMALALFYREVLSPNVFNEPPKPPP